MNNDLRPQAATVISQLKIEQDILCDINNNYDINNNLIATTKGKVKIEQRFPINIREVRAIKNGIWSDYLIKKGDITKINFNCPYKYSWYLLVNGTYVAYDSDELMRNFEAVT